ncbi:hypothetical protein N4R57_09180 [Rhodobacteraceae bacterium D3-12]|nr:hypothetical protein N4R57_09180 [Rhodobacteraceae bacterium D3-12]
MNAAAPISRPELTLPAAEAEAVRAAYAAADTILEYGSGGSTVLAGEMPGKRVFSVESDKGWAEMMTGWFADNKPAAKVRVIHADIGPTVEWGHPEDDRAWKRYAKYPLAVWEGDRMGQPDVVLVDGRFRLGCVLATAFHTQKPVPLLFDDYAQRKHYHVIEEVVGAPQEIIGRMARFEIHPMAVPVERLAWVIKVMTHP